jgi:hypothetical protein
MSSIFDHLNGKIRFRNMGAKKGPYKRKDSIVITWTLTMQMCGLSINLQQLKMKVAKLTQTRVTPFQDGIPGNSWWF